jgi:lipopolysaccharide/colanic/teichoic acid biosynthesis glycosyltransferase
MYKHFFKRVLDFLISLIAIICLSPFILVMMLLLHFANKGAGVFFLQDRPGKDAKIFNVIKFKSMTDETDENGVPLPNDQRITKIGKFMRKFSIDELPQLFNVLKGDMSLVGPRPLLTRYLLLYNQEQARRHEVRPGLTGWAQVHGRNNITWKEKFELDIWYVDHCSLWTDIKVIFMTIKNVLSGKDVSVVSGSFDGTN